MPKRQPKSQTRALGRGLDTIIRDTLESVPSQESELESRRKHKAERVSEIVSIRITPRQKEFITLYDKYQPAGESFAETFRKYVERMDRELGAKLREIEAETQALAKRLLQ